MGIYPPNLFALLVTLRSHDYHFWVDDDGLHYDAPPNPRPTPLGRQAPQDLEYYRDVLAALVSAGLASMPTLLKRFGISFFALPREEMLKRLAPLSFSIHEGEQDAIATVRRWRMEGRLDDRFARLPSFRKRDISIEKYRRQVNRVLTDAPRDDEEGKQARAWIRTLVDQTEGTYRVWDWEVQ